MNSNASFQVSSVDPDDLTFGYDAEGRRVSKNVYRRKNNAWQQTSATLFLYDGWNLAAECNATGGAIRTYLWGTDLSGSWEGAGGVGGLLWLNLATANPASSCFAEYDGNGNVTGLVRASDAMEVATYEFGPFGEPVRVSGIGALNPLQFSTKYTDTETGLLYYGYRYYNSATGRWFSRDPIGERGGLNVYACICNDTLNYVDLVGLRKLSEEQGEDALRAGLGLLQSSCDKQCNANTCCTAAQCKSETSEIVQALVRAWRANYGKGPYDDKAKGNDSVGGYLCWDWAAIFNNALSTLKPKCVSFEQGRADGPKGKIVTRVHYFLKVHTCKNTNVEYQVIFDDGFFDGEATAHPGAFPPENSYYTEVRFVSPDRPNWQPK